MMGDRLIATHVQDNYGVIDDHLLPFLGTVEWEPIMKTLKKSTIRGVRLRNSQMTDRLPDPMIDAMMRYAYELGNICLHWQTNEKEKIWLKSIWWGIALLTVIAISGCSAASKETTAEANTSKAPAAENRCGYRSCLRCIEIEFWHALESQYQETLNRVVGEFNDSHDNIVIKPMYIGNYTALNEAIVSANAANTNLPGVAMANIPYVTAYGAGGLCEDLGPLYSARRI